MAFSAMMLLGMSQPFSVAYGSGEMADGAGCEQVKPDPATVKFAAPTKGKLDQRRLKRSGSATVNCRCGRVAGASAATWHGGGVRSTSFRTDFFSSFGPRFASRGLAMTDTGGGRETTGSASNDVSASTGATSTTAAATKSASSFIRAAVQDAQPHRCEMRCCLCSHPRNRHLPKPGKRLVDRSAGIFGRIRCNQEIS